MASVDVAWTVKVVLWGFLPWTGGELRFLIWPIEPMVGWLVVQCWREIPLGRVKV